MKLRGFVVLIFIYALPLRALAPPPATRPIHEAERSLLAQVCRLECFSKVRISKRGECPYPSVVDSQQCTLFCKIASDSKKEDHSEKDYTVVDLRKMAERYTGYKEGRIIWKKGEELCEGDVFLWNLLSGIHCSVSIHLSAYYSDDPESNRKPYMSHVEMKKRVAASYLGNLKMTLEFLHACFPLAEKYMNRRNFPLSNRDLFLVQQLAQELSRRNVRYRQLVQGPRRRKGWLYRYPSVTENTLRRADGIVKLMNCMNCLKCKVWGKVQMKGLRTALKLVLCARDENASCMVTREDIVYFLNLTQRLTCALALYREYKEEAATFSYEEKKKARSIHRSINAAFCMLSFVLTRKRAKKG